MRTLLFLLVLALFSGAGLAASFNPLQSAHNGVYHDHEEGVLVYVDTFLDSALVTHVDAESRQSDLMMPHWHGRSASDVENAVLIGSDVVIEPPFWTYEPLGETCDALKATRFVFGVYSTGAFTAAVGYHPTVVLHLERLLPATDTSCRSCPDVAISPPDPSCT